MTTGPAPALTIGGTNAWHISIVPIRLLLVSAWISSSGMPSTLLGAGLPPEAPMSPPAQLTSSSTSPSFAFDVRLHLLDRGLVADIAGDGDRANAKRLDLLDDHPEVGSLAVFRRRIPVEVVDGDVGAKAGEFDCDGVADAPPRARDECDLAAQFLAHTDAFPCMMPALRMFSALRRIMSSS